MVTARSLVSPTYNALLEKALQAKIARRNEIGGSLGELEPLAIRLGLLQSSLRPRLQAPRLLIFAADHGLAVEGVVVPSALGSHLSRPTHETVRQLLAEQLPITAFARAQQLELTVVDCGLAEDLPAHERLLIRKIAHGTRNCRVSSAMSLDQAHAALRAGMQIGEQLRGNATLFAGIGVGAHESAALVLARLTDSPLHELVSSGPAMDPDHLAHLMAVLQAALARHHDATEPIDVLAAFGGFEMAVMAGVMLMAASKRHVLIVDGMAACAALMIAQRIALPVTDYCVFCRSLSHRGLDAALNLFRASALLELGMESTDGTGATLAWPMIRSAAALLTDVADAEEPGSSQSGAGGGSEPAPGPEDESLATPSLSAPDVDESSLEAAPGPTPGSAPGPEFATVPGPTAQPPP